MLLNRRDFFMTAQDLQRLTDEQIELRLATYNPGGRFGSDMKRLWELCSVPITDAFREHWTALMPRIQQGPYRHMSLEDFIAGGVAQFVEDFDANWARSQTEIARNLYLAKWATPPEILQMNVQLSLIVNRKLREALAHDVPTLRWATDTATSYFFYMCEIVLAQLAIMESHNASLDRIEQSSEFESETARLVENAVVTSSALREQTIGASESARGMLGKANEVATAAEESAVAMREAAHTAAGLIRAIEDARIEVERAAEVAGRAGDQASMAVETSQALSEQVEAIESILGLIRDIAGQTNLLALNATIEAARAGESGRGFAVVAQEVKSLASQTARATDDIAKKIAGIEAATRSTVDANGQIRKTISEVQNSAEQIRSAMEAQSQTVTMITAAVDETALTADSMSSTIAVIRQEAEGFGKNLDRVGAGFEELDSRLKSFAESTRSFLDKMAA
jgi:methyl-accepting chemotaxis protein